jgi:matrix metalloproteinase-14 (membrane-inserted)
MTRVSISLLLIILVSLHLCTAAPTGKHPEKDKALKHLKKYGYVSEDAPDPDESAMEADIKDFQARNGLKQTGKFDEDTMTLMDTPRCGVKEKEQGESGGAGRRRKRYAFGGSKWKKTRLTYFVSNTGTKLSPETVRSAVNEAINMWGPGVTRLRFTEVSSTTGDIEVLFAAGNHSDGYPFDGPMGTFAHAFYPTYGGDAHFDNDENWTMGVNYGVQFLQVAMHEFGHSLGLAHSNDTEAIMYAYYIYKPEPRLTLDDKLGIKALYG